MSFMQKAGTPEYSIWLMEYGQFGQSAIHETSVFHPPNELDVKRVMDILGAVAALVLFAALMASIFLILLASGGDPLFIQQRVGKNGALFRCYKFRSMIREANRGLTAYLDRNPQAQEEWNRSFKLQRDPRVTWFGAFLRRTSMDELPQLINVLKGEMSLVGPRPIVPNEIERYAGRIASYYSCKPGITGLWQVSGRNLVAYERRVRLDAIYARKQCLWLDTIILLRTVRVVLSGAGAS